MAIQHFSSSPSYIFTKQENHMHSLYDQTHV